jgi:chaperonin GroES
MSISKDYYDGKILVTPIEFNDINTSGIMPLGFEKRDLQCAQVYAAFPGKLLDNGNRAETYIKTGDIVFYLKNRGELYQFFDKKYTILRVEDVISVVENIEYTKEVKSCI